MGKGRRRIREKSRPHSTLLPFLLSSSSGSSILNSCYRQRPSTHFASSHPSSSLFCLCLINQLIGCINQFINLSRQTGMAGYNKLLKRKGLELDHVGDDLDLSDFPLSSPATKIRRLDAAELPPIAEALELEHDEPLPTAPTPIAATPELEAAPAPAPNEERALVLFKPLLHSSSSPFSLTLNPGLLSQFKKDQAHWSKHRDSDCDRLLTTAAEREEEEKKNRGMALVPWVPSSSTSTQFPILQDSNNTELMEADDESEGAAEGSMMMDVEQQDTTVDPQTSTIYPTASTLQLSHGGIAAAETSAPEGLHHQWHQQQQQQQQQHCLLPQIPRSTSTPITWTR